MSHTTWSVQKMCCVPSMWFVYRAGRSLVNCFKTDRNRTERNGLMSQLLNIHLSSLVTRSLIWNLAEVVCHFALLVFFFSLSPVNFNSVIKTFPLGDFMNNKRVISFICIGNLWAGTHRLRQNTLQLNSEVHCCVQMHSHDISHFYLLIHFIKLV